MHPIPFKMLIPRDHITSPDFYSSPPSPSPPRTPNSATNPLTSIPYNQLPILPKPQQVHTDSSDIQGNSSTPRDIMNCRSWPFSYSLGRFASGRCTRRHGRGGKIPCRGGVGRLVFEILREIQRTSVRVLE